MPLETLETMRLLTNLETEKRKLMQVDPVRPARARSQARLGLGAPAAPAHHLPVHAQRRSTRDEVADYVAHRLTIAGYSGPAVFATGALGAMHRASRGVPRLVNILAHKALLVVYGEGGRKVERSHMRAAVEDTPTASWRWWWRAA